MKRQLRRLAGKWRRAAATAAFCHRIVPCSRMAYPLLVWRAWRLCRREGFEPAEAFRLGLFRPRASQPAVEYISRKRLTKAQEALNPVAWAPLLKNKDLFYRYCAAVEVPVPRLYAVIHPGLPGWTHTGQCPRTRGEWTAFFDDSLPDEFAAKPAQGAYGHGFNIFRRSPGGYRDATGVQREAGALYDLLAGGDPSAYIIQERLRSHPELTRLSGTEALQAVRMITLVDDDGQVRLLHAHLKIIEGEEVIDTLIRGLTGNIEAPVDLQHGTLRTANRVLGTGVAVATVPTHPRTAVPFEGLRLPFWTQAARLVRQTALHFLPIRTIGWDVALTPESPVILEGNVWWDPPNQHGHMGDILRMLHDPSLAKAL